MEKVFEDDKSITQRFSCDCNFPGHILDVSVDLADSGKRVIECTFSLYMGGKAPLKYRLKQIWRLLRGEEGQLADFILKQEDILVLAGLLSRAVIGSNKSTPIMEP